jgi:hypothetical protein
VGFPLVEQLTHTRPAALPLDRAFGLTGDALGFGNQAFPVCASLLPGRRSLSGVLGTPLLDRCLDLGHLGFQGCEVPDDVGFPRLLTQLGVAVLRVLGGHLGVGDALEQ